MAQTGSGNAAAEGRTCGGGTISLPVLAPGGRAGGRAGGKSSPNLVRKSRMGRWRAIVLIAVHVIIAAHIIQWLVTGMTLSPVEPSESMYTLETGAINAGFVMFALAILSTVLFGRFFCGWACHVVALQDLCGSWMQKLGVRPRPWRTRLPLYWATLLALYMFVWPTVLREAVVPILDATGTARPTWAQDAAPFPGLRPEFMVEDFWRTFPPWYIAIPFLAVCGFATVYFLGNKGFCTYACPYGGFFAPLDKISVGKIVVSDACNQCGHCTTACSSNVRVHQEVKDYGMVVDPGCMKCLDCVSVCPNDALGFGFRTPSLLAPARTSPEVRAKASRPRSDLSWVEEAWVFVLGIALFVAFRQFLNMVPLLMAAGIAIIGAFGVWKLTRLLRDPNVTFQNLQLKLKGRLRPAGMVFGAGVLVLTGVGAWSGAVRFFRWRADTLDRAIVTPFELVYSPGYAPAPEDKANAERALALYGRSLAPSEGGFGWGPTPDMAIRMSWLSSVAGDLPRAEAHLRRAFSLAPPGDDLVFGLARMRALQGDGPEQALELYQDMLAKHPSLHQVRLATAQLLGSAGRLQEAGDVLGPMYEATRRRPTPQQATAGAEILIALGRTQEAIRVLEAQRTRSPKVAMVRAMLARGYYVTGRKDDALAELVAATEHDEQNPVMWSMLSGLFSELGRPVEAAQAARRAEDLARQARPVLPPGAGAEGPGS
ncbi:MAG: tetratricopeptide repeat protein [Planctomycetota bacterium]|nr:tetratricopeptide repeat protein [Planctomycetota bacterium]